MLSFFLSFDVRLTNFINGLLPHNNLFDNVFSILSGYGSAFILWVVIGLLLIIFEEKRHRKFIWSFLMAIFSSSFLVNNVLKNLFQRPRPNFLLGATNFCSTGFSFPSGHATVAFAAAVVLAKYDPKRTKIYYTIAVLVSLSRIYFGCHFFLDVTVGALIGYFVAKAVTELFFRLS